MEEKLLRFIELSKKFSLKPEVLEGYRQNNNLICSGTLTYTGYQNISITSEKIEIKKISELIQDEADTKKQLADDWEEFVVLQKDFEDYYKALLKIK